MHRSFSSGSRQAPDPFDQFLEDNNYYRKHTARDSSCLFRVISEQMYDTQLHHLQIRKKCVRYMRKHREYYGSLVDRDFDEYLDDMSKPKTYGTLVELQAIGCMFGRNVLLFEPFSLGKFYCQRPYFNDVFRVFYTPERHFDSVYTSDYIKDAAICQSICYEILYKDLFKLPDVSYAVEYMLHGQTFETNEIRSELNDFGYCTRLFLPDGREFILDLPHTTNCILENHKLCHFHYTDFPSFADDLQREMTVYKPPHREDYDKNVALCKTAESLLPHKYISCVRQLLDEGITPFPYKVAKALDPNMYRNIEFDAWNEARKELKLQNWYNGDANFKVGAKCHVQLRKSQNDLYTCHIQEIAVDKGYCIVFVEQLGEKRVVPYDSLSPLPPDQFKPWALPYRIQRHMQKYSSIRWTRHCNYRLKLNEQYSSTHRHEYCGAGTIDNMKTNYCTLADEEDDLKASANACYYKLKQYTHLENFRTHTVEYCTMPLTVTTDMTDIKGACANNRNCRSSSRSPPPTPHTAGGGGGDAGDMNHGLDESGAPNLQPALMMHPYDQHEHAEVVMPGHMAAPYGGEYGGYYPMPSYIAVAPEEYYGAGFDGGMNQSAVMPHNSGGATYYYMCPGQMGAAPYPAASNNLYMPAVPPMHTGAPIVAGAAPQGVPNAYYQQPYYAAAAATNPMPAVAAGGPPPNGAIRPQGGMAASYHGSPMPRGRGNFVGGGQAPSRTPLSSVGRINFEARKSFRADGSDLPTDPATLRYFFNLGLDCMNWHNRDEFAPNNNNTNNNNNNSSNTNTDDGGTVAGPAERNDSVISVTVDLQAVKLDDNASRAPTPDSNNNVSAPPSTQNAVKPQGGYAGRRYNSRSNNSTHYNKNNVNIGGRERERTNYTHQNNNFASHAPHHPPPRNPISDYNRNAYVGGGHAHKVNAPPHNPPISNRPPANQQPQQSANRAPNPQHGATNVGPPPGKVDAEVGHSAMPAQYVNTDNAAAQNATVVAYGPYDCAGAVGGVDVNGMPPAMNVSGAPQQPAAGNAGVYLAGPYGPPGPYGIYANSQTMPPPMGMHAGAGPAPPPPGPYHHPYINASANGQYPMGGMPATPGPFNGGNYYNTPNGYVVDSHDHGMRNEGCAMPFPPCMAYPPPPLSYLPYVASPQNPNSNASAAAVSALPPPQAANTHNYQNNSQAANGNAEG